MVTVFLLVNDDFCCMTLIVRQACMCQIFSISRHNHKHNGALSCRGDGELHPHFALTWAGHLQFKATNHSPHWIVKPKRQSSFPCLSTGSFRCTDSTKTNIHTFFTSALHECQFQPPAIQATNT
jgi:hypothetical protein